MLAIMNRSAANTNHMSDDPDPGGPVVRRDDDDLKVVEHGKSDAHAVLLLSNAAAPTAIWDPVVPVLAGAFRVIRVDLLGECGLASPAGRYDIPAQAARIGTALDRLGVSRVTVIGHSSGCMLATALAEQRPGAVVALALIDMGPNLDAKLPDSPLFHLIMSPVIGPLLWRLRTPESIRKAARDGTARRVDIPDAFIEPVQRLTLRDLVGTLRAARAYLGQRSLTDRLAPLGLPLLVIFGADDGRWRSSSAAEYTAVPGARVELLAGVGHTPMMEDPESTGALLLDFAESTVSAGGS
jgi:pimeloyl-ACP methyl ester carboxylesterase